MQTEKSNPRRSRSPASNFNAASAAPQIDRPKQASSDVSHDEIARRAYSRWEESDRSPGHDQEHWFAAESELRGANESEGGSRSAAANDQPDSDGWR